MNKIKFELYLREKLDILKQSEIDEIISEYLQHIDMRKADGISEEEAINDFGDLDELVREILDAYKIDTSNDQFENFSNTIKNWLNSALNYINSLTSSLMQRSGKEMISLIVEFVLVLILLWGVTFALDIVANRALRIFYFSPYFLTRMIRFVIRVLSTILNLTVSLSILYWFANERILSKDVSQKVYADDLDAKLRQKRAEAEKRNQNQTNDALSSEEIVIDNEDNLNFKTSDQEKKVIRPDIARENLEAQVDKKPFGKVLFDGNMLVLRIVGFLILIPMIVGAVFLGIFFITVIYNTFKGYGSIGITIVLSGVCLIYFYLLTLGINFVSGGVSK